MSEMEPEGFKKFPTVQHFASWTKLAPNNKISGGKALSNYYHKEVTDSRWHMEIR